MNDIFLSYNREDAATAKRFADGFAAEGLSVWWDTALRSGEAYDEVTEAALRGAKAVVVLWSPRSVVSRWVRAEATIADRCKTLVPVTIETCERPIMFELTQTAELSHWTGDGGDRAWQAFLDDVRGFVGREAVLEPAQVPLPAAPTVQETLKPGQSGSAPSLAVLPFTNRSGLPEDEVFAEGMVEDVISALTQGVNVRVLGATATANLNRAAILDLSAVGRQLGVRYLLEGNVRRVGANLRVTAQLLEADTGAAIWTAKFDRPLAELAELQEELVTEIAASLDTQVYALEMERALRKPSDITAWEAVARAWSAYRKWEPEDRVRGIEEARRAVTIAPDYALAHAMLAVTLADAYLLSTDDPSEVRRIRNSVDRALSLGPEDASVLAMVGFACSYLGYTEEGVRHTGKAVHKAPGSGDVHFRHGVACCMHNQAKAALLHFDTAVRLSQGWHLLWAVKGWRSMALVELECWAEAQAAAIDGIALGSTFGVFHVIEALCSTRLGNDADVEKHIATARSVGWELAVAEQFWRRTFINSPSLEAHIVALRALYAATEPGA